jgi:hypothetical protein
MSPESFDDDFDEENAKHNDPRGRDGRPTPSYFFGGSHGGAPLFGSDQTNRATIHTLTVLVTREGELAFLWRIDARRPSWALDLKRRRLTALASSAERSHFILRAT